MAAKIKIKPLPIKKSGRRVLSSSILPGAPSKDVFTVLNVVGARPNFMKMAPIMRAMKNNPALKPLLLHTGQHYDWEMSKIFFEQLGLGEPDFHLGAGSGSHAKQIAKIMTESEKVFASVRPDLVVVVGDVNSTLACGITAKKMGIPVAHVEAGLRSRDMAMPEEINRIVTDSIADLLFTTCRDAGANLLAEGAGPRKIHFAGNVMIDTLIHCKPEIDKSDALKRFGLKKGRYALITLHRPSNVDAPEQLRAVSSILKMVCSKLPLVYPVHPRTAARMKEFGIDLANAGVITVPPLGYFDFVRLTRDATVVLTDSGGIQEETTFLGVPCLTLRENTERPITVATGTNKIVGLDFHRIEREIEAIISGKYKKGRIPSLWDGHAADRIVFEIVKYFLE
jgi:UDP-N-acetylglucosamine 2-epimerase (non-hydrolysing)